MKPGYKTSEFWVAIGAHLIGILVVVGVLSGDDAQNLNEAISAAAEALVGLGIAVVPLMKYIESRGKIKEAEFYKMPMPPTNEQVEG